MIEGKEIINDYELERKANGDLHVSIANKGTKDVAQPFLVLLISLAAVIAGFFIDGDLSYVLWIIGGMILVLSVFGVYSVFQPLVFVVSKQSKTIRFKSRLANSIFTKDQIEDLKFSATPTNRAATSIAGKTDVCTIDLVLKNGEQPEFLILRNRTSNLTRTYEEENDGNKIIKEIKKTLEIN